MTQTVLKNNVATTTYAYRGICFTPGTRDSLYVRVPQAITFNAISNKAVGTADFYTNATTTSGLQLGYTTSDLNVATVNNGLISIVGPGTVTITANQTGDFKYLGATSVSRTFTVLNNLRVAPGQQMAVTTGDTYGNVLVEGELTLNAPLTALGTITVASGGVLNTNCQPITGPADFTAEAGAELRICDAAGLLPTGTMSGAVQTTGTRVFSPEASYVYLGTQAQQTGTGLPAEVRGLLVQNPAGVTLSAPLQVRQLLRLTQGNLMTGSQPLTLLSDADGTALVDNAGGVVQGTVTVQRYLDPSLNPGLGYRHYSAPVSNTTVADLSTSGFAPVVAQCERRVPHRVRLRPGPAHGYGQLLRPGLGGPGRRQQPAGRGPGLRREPARHRAGRLRGHAQQRPHQPSAIVRHAFRSRLATAGQPLPGPPRLEHRDRAGRPRQRAVRVRKHQPVRRQLPQLRQWRGGFLAGAFGPGVLRAGQQRRGEYCAGPSPMPTASAPSAPSRPSTAPPPKPAPWCSCA